MPEFPIRPAISGFLPNGLKYILHSDDSNQVLCLQLYIRVGSAWERPREAGYAHFMEHLAFKSTRDFGYNQIMNHVNSLGGSINAYTDFDCTCYYLLLPSEYLAEGLKVLSELAIHPSFTQEDLAMEKDIIIEEMEQNKNDQESDFLDFIQSAAFQKSPLRRPVLGTKKSVKDARLNDMQAFHRRYYLPENCFLVIVGDHKTIEAESLISQNFGDWNASNRSPTPYDGRFDEPEPPAKPHVWRKRRQEFLAWIVPELCDTHPDSDALLLVMRYLAIGRSSRLFKRLVEEEKLASSVKVSSFSGVMSGVSAIVVSPMRARYLDKIRAIFQQEYLALLQGLFDPDELALVKKDVINSWLYGFNGVENLAGMIGAEEFVSGFEQLYIYDQQILPLSLGDVHAAVLRHWQPANLQLIHQSLKAANLSLPELTFKKSRNPEMALQATTPADFPIQKKGKNQILAEYSSGVHTATLPNGLKFIYHFQPQRPVSGFALSTDVCQLFESPSQRGLNYLCSGAMLHSTRSRSYSEMLRISRELGISLNVEPHSDNTVFRGKCFPSALPTALGILAEIFWQPAFEINHIRLLKQTSIDLLRRDYQDPSSHAFFRWFRMIFGPNSVYGRYSGNISDLARHKRQDIIDWYETWYHPDRFSLAIVGSEEPQKVMNLVGELFAGGTQSQSLPPDAGNPLPSPTRLKTQKLDSGQAIIHLGGFAAPARDRTETTAFHILSQILGGDMDSRLFNVIREKYGYAYQTGFEYSSAQQLGYWFAYSYCDIQDSKPCLKLMREIIGAVRSEGVTPTELQYAQNYLCGMNRFEAESPALQAVLLASLSALGYEPDFYLDRERRIRSVNIDTINLVAAKWLQSTNQWTHVLL